MIKPLIFATVTAVVMAIGFPTSSYERPIEVSSLRLVSESTESNMEGFAVCTETVLTREVTTVKCYDKNDRQASLDQELPEVKQD